MNEKYRTDRFVGNPYTIYITLKNRIKPSNSVIIEISSCRIKYVPFQGIIRSGEFRYI